MSQLLNHRHETFARAVAAGIPVKYAYEMAGYAFRRSGHAYQLADRPEVMIRIAELRSTESAASLSRLGQFVNELRQLTMSLEHLADRSFLGA